jgi:hypothetical protein
MRRSPSPIQAAFIQTDRVDRGRVIDTIFKAASARALRWDGYMNAHSRRW